MIVREIDVSDAEAAARLSGELGYPSSVSEMEERIRSLADLRDRIIYIAAEGDTVIAWIDVGVVHHLQTEPYAEIGGLVVSSECRSMGVGAQLVKQAEEWAKDRGLQKVVVRSQIAREAAHRFYLRHGYERTKTSAVFSKLLS